MTENKPGRPPIKKTFKCEINNIWTTEGKLTKGQSKELPAKEVEDLTVRQNEIIERALAAAR